MSQLGFSVIKFLKTELLVILVRHHGESTYIQ